MPRIVIIGVKAAEAEDRATVLRAAGMDVQAVAPDSAAGLRPLRESPPDAFVIDLTRLPSQGRAIALELRRTRSTRMTPLVFAGGAPEKVAQTRELLPDAVYTGWSNVAEAVRHAIAQPPANPAAPGTMAGYAGTPLVKKLGIRPGSLVALLGAPERFESLLEGLPENARIARHAGGGADTVLLFVRSRADLERRFGPAARRVKERGGLWIVWPKKGSRAGAGLTQLDVRAHGLAAGWVDYKICAVDQTWSGLLFARRRV